MIKHTIELAERFGFLCTQRFKSIMALNVVHSSDIHVYARCERIFERLYSVGDKIGCVFVFSILLALIKLSEKL